MKDLENCKNLIQCYKTFQKLKDEEVSIFYSNLHDVSPQYVVFTAQKNEVFH